MDPSLPSLLRAVWLYLVVPRVTILIALTQIEAMGGWPLWLFYTLLLTDLGLLGWQSRRVLQCADAHVQAFGGLSRVWGSYLICLFMVFATGAVWWGLYLASTFEEPEENFAEMMDRQHAEQYNLSISDDGKTLTFEGIITHGLTRNARALMSAHPDVTQIRLTSDGGHVYEARGFARLIQSAALTTIVVRTCNSTCTLLFIAGSRRQLENGARLGFHQYALKVETPLLNLDPVKEQARDKAFFVDQGVHADFANRLYDAPNSGIWYPTRNELQSGGVLTRP